MSDNTKVEEEKSVIDDAREASYGQALIVVADMAVSEVVRANTIHPAFYSSATEALGAIR